MAHVYKFVTMGPYSVVPPPLSVYSHLLIGGLLVVRIEFPAGQKKDLPPTTSDGLPVTQTTFPVTVTAQTVGDPPNVLISTFPWTLVHEGVAARRCADGEAIYLIGVWESASELYRMEWIQFKMLTMGAQLQGENGVLDTGGT